MPRERWGGAPWRSVAGAARPPTHHPTTLRCPVRQVCGERGHFAGFVGAKYFDCPRKVRGVGLGDCARASGSGGPSRMQHYHPLRTLTPPVRVPPALLPLRRDGAQHQHLPLPRRAGARLHPSRRRSARVCRERRAQAGAGRQARYWASIARMHAHGAAWALFQRAPRSTLNPNSPHLPVHARTHTLAGTTRCAREPSRAGRSTRRC